MALYFVVAQPDCDDFILPLTTGRLMGVRNRAARFLSLMIIFIALKPTFANRHYRHETAFGLSISSPICTILFWPNIAILIAYFFFKTLLILD